MKKNIVLLIILCLATSPIISIEHHKTAYEIGNETIDRLYHLCIGVFFGGLSYEFGTYAYKSYSDTHKSDTYIDSAIDGLVKAKDAIFGAHQEGTGIESEIDIEQLLIIPAALLSLGCGFYALTAINKALFYIRHVEQKRMQQAKHTTSRCTKQLSEELR